jgi:N-acetyl-beta-hexosaminidase
MYARGPLKQLNQIRPLARGQIKIAHLFIACALHYDTVHQLCSVNCCCYFRSVQSFTDNAVNPCINSTYEFISHVIRQMVILHQGIQNLTIFHFGGDEVPPDAWTNSTACNDLKTNLNKPNMTSADMKSYFVQRSELNKLCTVRPNDRRDELKFS